MTILNEIDQSWLPMDLVVIGMFGLVVLLFGCWLSARSRLRKMASEFEKAVKELKELRTKFEPVLSVEGEVIRLQEQALRITSEIAEARTDYAEKRTLLTELEQEIAVYDERVSFAKFGVYEPHFEFDDSEAYKAQIKKIRESQREMISAKIATQHYTDWHHDGSLAKGRVMVNRQIRLTLRAFNSECEAAIANARWNNVTAMENRILNAAKQINRANASMGLTIDEQYVSLKLDELHLKHEYQEQRKKEKDERLELAQAEREEKRLLADLKKAEREERRYQDLLTKARREAGTDELRIAELEAALAEAQARSKRARSMAEITKSGYVYIISNIGSFGDQIVKIGLTRRVDPQERVRELSGASVPFRFDTHAMIYSEDAPALENALHQEFSDRRINAANMRKEFFEASIDEIEKAVSKLAPHSHFFRDREAQEWHETLARRRQALDDKQLATDRFPPEI